MTFAHLEVAISTILKAQGFTDRAQQYEIMRPLDSITGVSRHVAKHKVSGHLLEMRVISKSHQDTSIFRAEIQALQILKHNSQTVGCLDFFEENQSLYVVMSGADKISLA